MRFRVKKRIEIAGCHCLALPYESKCSNLHGHNWIITVEVGAESLTRYGMVVDFKHIADVVRTMDHADLNQWIQPHWIVNEKVNPTAENIAVVLVMLLNQKFSKLENTPRILSIAIQESEGNTICYIP